MPEPETPTTPTTPETPTTPAPGEGTPTTPSTPATPDNDPVALAKEVGRLKTVEEEFAKYKKQVDPVLETLWTDRELLEMATERHNKRLGIVTKDATPPAKPGEGTPATPAAPADTDTRNAMVNQISADFEAGVGINKLTDEEKGVVRGKVGSMLKEMLDPKGNKSIAQVFEEVSLTKLPWYLEKAYQLINRDNDITRAKEQGASEVRSQYEESTGVIGPVGGGSVPIDQMTLTPKEKKAAFAMGVSDEDYLKEKKKMAEAN